MRFGHILFCLAIVSFLFLIGQNFSRASFIGEPILPDPDLKLSANPTVEELIAAGKWQIDQLRLSDQTLDRNQELTDYFRGLAAKLLASYDAKLPYPIEIHVSTAPVLNAYVDAGGQMVFFAEMVENCDNEAQLVAILGHEMSHEIHNDFAFFWHAAKEGESSYGKGGLLEKSRAIEQRADLDSTRMMYAAGWDPREQLTIMRRIAKRSLSRRDAHRIFYSTHPDDPERIKAINDLIGTLVPK